MNRLLTITISVALAAAGSFQATAAQQQPSEVPPTEAAKPAPYDDQLTRLSEILGSLDFIRNLCAEKPEPQWKSMMNALLESDAKDEAERKARLTAAFNRGYHAFAAIQTGCSAPLREVADRYRIEGATLATEIAARFGN